MQEPQARFRDLTLDAFVSRLASAEPVPGGGSASAVAASLAAGLVAMVASLSEGRPKYAMYIEVHRRTKAAGLELADRLLRIADEDAASYAAFGTAMKMPRETVDEQAARTTAIQAAARVAAEVPLRCVEACLEVVENAELLAARCNVNASSDLDVAALLAEAAARGAAANVLVNLPSIGDPEWGAEATSRVNELMARISALASTTRAVVASGELRAPITTPTTGVAVGGSSPSGAPVG
ncbi:MAG: cyclodeaminase/cyclohydrolase family protein [Chloroflexi bacterium]|nr:cyclodeaminase/cyclohydrolase family protein [Chloroflexota bacterium]